ncbi:YdeI/OmpD-associated family protein [Pedobacter sandarakinus]|uniref:YdeI/OmpD-associated family protein n=1 Tax=Pedobacter sandarakinus TaxID=353156 RepID=UPI002246457E|nr:YdeI/OmpD-associated family protein [Pedobacter sandarakinus]MCX2575515.1 YdeI/OmpD-associated family protein [Pedobacter sandarakinus]
MKHNVQVDRYILEAAPFAQPILNHLRTLIHIACSDIEETIKWGMPFFDYKGSVCHIAAFKNHCALGFWKGSLMEDEQKLFQNSTNAMGMLGKIKSLADLPDDETLIAYILKAVKLNEDGVKLPPKVQSKEKQELVIPKYFLAALAENTAALSVFQDFSPSKKKDYVLWLEEAKTEATKQKRLETAIEWIAEGKSRMWKYEK